mmetsp:Transcript_16249/g.13069  ORF Transcript_16249/g.13069 Transcript_16249/m.13069 type:complete len:103 (-) Transcript_16249:13-321(-)
MGGGGGVVVGAGPPKKFISTARVRCEARRPEAELGAPANVSMREPRHTAEAAATAQTSRTEPERAMASGSCCGLPAEDEWALSFQKIWRRGLSQNGYGPLAT